MLYNDKSPCSLCTAFYEEHYERTCNSPCCFNRALIVLAENTGPYIFKRAKACSLGHLINVQEFFNKRVDGQLNPFLGF